MAAPATAAVLATTLTVDVAVIGGGLGGIAAALAAAETGARVVLTAEESVVGGQVTAQLTSPLDEHPLVESIGVTATYRRFRNLVREASGGQDNPGGGWVSRLCFEPLIGLQVLEDMLRDHIVAGRIQLLTDASPIEATNADGQPIQAGSDSRIGAVRLRTPDGVEVSVQANVFIDATEAGDLLPLTASSWVIGSEGSDAYGEPAAVRGSADPLAEQSCTWVAVLVRENKPQPIGEPPAGYASVRDTQPFSLDLDGDDGAVHRYRFFTDGPDGLPPFWEYRRIRTGSQLDAAVINWAGNDYRDSGLIAEPARTHREARELTLAFVHWLRTEVPRDPEDGPGPLGTGRGYPELRLAPELTGTPDGLAAAPYVRESRRLGNPGPMTWHDIARVGEGAATSPAPEIQDSVAIAWYHADLHARIGHPASVYAPTAPFQIPARALVPARGVGPRNLVMGAKNLAATQVAAAATRVHPAEWAIGEAAGVLAALSCGSATDPLASISTPAALSRLQSALLDRGAPLSWRPTHSPDLEPNHIPSEIHA